MSSGAYLHHRTVIGPNGDQPVFNRSSETVRSHRSKNSLTPRARAGRFPALISVRGNHFVRSLLVSLGETWLEGDDDVTSLRKEIPLNSLISMYTKGVIFALFVEFGDE